MHYEQIQSPGWRNLQNRHGSGGEWILETISIVELILYQRVFTSVAMILISHIVGTVVGDGGLILETISIVELTLHQRAFISVAMVSVW